MEIALNSIVRIYSEQKKIVGTGFLLDKNLGVTCSHVVKFCQSEKMGEKILLDFPSSSEKKCFTARVIFNDDEIDILGFEIEGNTPDDVYPVKLIESSPFDKHKCISIGFPPGYQMGILSEGKIIGNNTSSSLQIEALNSTGYFIQSGFSGSPVWLDNQKNNFVVGMIVEAEKDPKNSTAFALTVEMMISSWPTLKRYLYIDKYPIEFRPHLEKLSKIQFRNSIINQDLAPVFIREIDLAGIKEKSKKAISFSEFEHDMLLYDNKSYILIGEAGIGKTTEMLRIAKHFSDHVLGENVRTPIPIYIELRRFRSKTGRGKDFEKHIIEELNLVNISKDEILAELRKENRFILLLDGINEINLDNRSQSIESLLDFLRTYHNLQYILSTRYYGFPEHLLNIVNFPITCYEIQRWEKDQIEIYFKTNNMYEMFTKLDVKIQNLCSIPYAAHLLLNVLEATRYSLDVNLPHNKGELYNSYVNSIFSGSESKNQNKFEADFKSTLLSKIAFNMNQSETLNMEFNVVKHFVEINTDKDELSIRNDTHLSEAINELIKNGVLIQGGSVQFKHPKPNTSIEFVHQSLQEYFTALYISRTTIGGYLNYFPSDFHENEYWRDVPTYLIGLIQNPLNFLNELLQAMEIDDHLLVVAKCLISCEINENDYQNMLQEIIDVRFVSSIQKPSYSKDAIEIIEVLGEDAVQHLIVYLDEVDEISEVCALSGNDTIERKWRKYGRIIYILGELNRIELVEKVNAFLKKVKDTHLLYHIVIALYTLQHAEAEVLLQDKFITDHADPIIRTFSLLSILRNKELDSELQSTKSRLMIALIENMNDKSENAFAKRAHSAEALGLLGLEESIEPLYTLLKNENLIEPQSSAIKTLGNIAIKLNQGKINSRIIDIFIELLCSGKLAENSWGMKMIKNYLHQLITIDDVSKIEIAYKNIHTYLINSSAKKNLSSMLQDLMIKM